MPSTTSATKSGNAYVDGLLSGVKWAASSFTFSFPTSASFYGTGYGSGEPGSNFEAVNSVQQAAVRATLKMYSSVANVTFTEVTETASVHGDFRYAMSDLPGTAWAYYPTTNSAGGDAWFNNSTGWYDNPLSGNYAWASFIHETGHAMGLKHPHEVSGSFAAEPVDHDSLEYTVMSYRSYIGASTSTGYTNGSTSYPQTLMMLDIAALQQMYGANFTTNSGDSIYTWNPSTGQMSINTVGQTAPAGNKIFMTVWDGGGTDTYDFSNYTTNLKIDLTPGGWTTTSTTQLAALGSGKVAVGNIANALQYNGNAASLIENAVGGTGNDTILGNAANNKITGGKGNDAIDGGAGSNTAVYSGTQANYTQVKNVDGSWTVTDLRTSNGDGIDTLKNIQFLQFTDKTVDIGASGGVVVVVPPVTVNHAPVGSADTYSVIKDRVFTVSAANGVLANDTDSDGNVLTAKVTTSVSTGKLNFNADGSFTYTPKAGFTGPVSFKYKVSDGTATSGEIKVTLNVAKAGASSASKGNLFDMSDDQMPTFVSDSSGKKSGVADTGGHDWAKSLLISDLIAGAAHSAGNSLGGLGQIEQFLSGLGGHDTASHVTPDDHSAGATGLPDFLHAFYSEFTLA